MVTILSLWLPILIASVLVYIVAVFLYMATPLHSRDFAKLRNEDAVMDVLRAQGVTQGQYMFPGAESNKDWSSPEWIEKADRGPVGLLFVHASGIGMLKQLVFQGIFVLVISTMAGYMGSASLPRGAEYLEVFQVVGTAAFLAHSAGHFVHAIWFGFSWKITWLRALEGLLYGVLTAGIFGWLWPG